MPSDNVAVLVSDLERLRDALNAAHYQNLAFDMLEAYRQLDNSGKQSRLTNTLSRQVEKVNGYLAYAEQEEEEEDE